MDDTSETDVLSPSIDTATTARLGETYDLLPTADRQTARVGAHLEETASRRRQPITDEEWEKEIAPSLQRLAPGIDPDELRKGYEQHRGLEIARDRFSDAQEKPGSFLLRKSVPWAARVQNLKLRQNYEGATQRFNAGRASETDLNDIAAFERLQEVDAERRKTTLGAIQEGVAGIPAIAGEAWMGGKALSTLGKAVPALGFLAPEAEAAAPTLLRSASLGARAEGVAATAAGTLGRTAAHTALTPSIGWLEGAQSNALERGGKITDVKNLAPAFALGMLQTAVLGAVGSEAAGVPGSGWKALGQKLAVGTTTGVAGQQVADLTGKALGLQSRYGLLQDLAEGKGGEALKEATVQAATFALFAGMHGGDASEAVEKFKGAVDEMAARGYSPDAAGRHMAEAWSRVVANAELQARGSAEPARPMPKLPAKMPAVKTWMDFLEKTAAEAPKPAAEAAPPPAPEKPAEAPPAPESPQGTDPAEAAPAPNAPESVPAAQSQEPHPAAMAFQKVFGQLSETPDGGLRGVVGSGPDAVNVYLKPGSHAGAVKLDFTRAGEEAQGLAQSEPRVGQRQAGTLDLVRNLSRFVDEFKKTGLDLEYVANGRRAKSYASLLEKAGFVQVDGPTGESGATRTWRPGEAEQARTDLERLYDESGLGTQEKHVVRERLAGRTHEDIAGDEAMRRVGRKPLTRQRVQQIERDALAKLGSDRSIDEAVRQEQRASAAADAVERGETVGAADLHADQEGRVRSRRVGRIERTEKELDRLADEWAKEAESGNPDPDRLRAIERAAVEGHRRLAGGPGPQEEAPAGLAEQAPVGGRAEAVRPAAELGLPEAPAAAGGGPPPETAAGSAQGVGQTPPAPAGGGETRGHQLTPADKARRSRNRAVYKEGWEQHRIRPEEVDAHVAELRKLDAAEQRRHDEFRSDVEGLAPAETKAHLRMIGMERYEESESIPGFDVLADALAERYPEMVKRGEKPTDAFFRVLKEGRPEPLSEREAHEEALRQLVEMKEFRDAQRQAASKGHTTAGIAESVQRGEEDSAGAEGTGSEPAEGPVVPATFDFGANVADFLRGESAALNLDRLGTVVRGAYERVKQFADDALDSVKRFLAPASRKGAGAAADVVREHNAALVRKTEIAREALKSGKAFFDAIPEPARPQSFRVFADAIEQGRIASLPDGLRQIAQAVRELTDERTQQLLDRGILHDFIENYFGHVWKRRGQTGPTTDDLGAAFGKEFARRPLAGSESFRKRRSIPTYEEGIDQHGLEPVSWNPVDIALLKLRQMDKSIMGRDVFNELKENGLVRFFRLGDASPEGWTEFNDKLSKAFSPPVIEHDGESINVGGPILGGLYMAPEPVATLLNNHLSPGWRGNMAYDAVHGFGNVLNQFQLGFSAFHAAFVAMDTQISAAALGLQHLARGEFGKALAKLPEATVPLYAPVRQWFQGSKMLREYYSPGSQGAEMGQIMKAFVEAGGRAKMDDFYGDTSHMERFRNALRGATSGDARKIGGVLWNALPALAEAVSYPVMNMLVTRMKMGIFADMARAEMERLGPNADPKESRAAMGRAWDSVENRMGQMTYDNIFWNRSFKDVLMAGVRSVGWNLGTWRELGGGLRDLGKLAGGALSSRTAYTVALPMVTALYAALYQYIATGKGPDEAKDYFFPKTGRTRPDGAADRVSLPSYVRDVAALSNRGTEGPFTWVKNSADMAKAKANPGIRTAWEMMSNEDFHGKSIRNPADPTVKQAKDLAMHLIGDFEPLGFRSFEQQGEAGASLGQRMQGFVGVTPAPASVARGADQQLQDDLKRKVYLTPLQKKLREDPETFGYKPPKKGRR